VIAALLFALAAAPQPRLDQMSLAKLRARIVLTEVMEEGDSKGAARGLAIARCAPAAVFAVLTDHSKFAEFMPRIAAVEVSRRTDTGERALQTVDATLATVRYALDYRWDPAALRVEFTLAEDVPRDIKAARGSWQLWALDGGKSTLIEYRTAADIGRWVPGPVRRYLQTSGVRDAVEAIRRRAER